jgi:hypothetical protein
MRRALALLALLAAIAGCDTAPDTTDEVRGHLVGTWLRDYEQDGTHIRRTLELAPDGHFRELSRSLGPQDIGTRHAHEGEWLYDGTNLKRRYTRMDGQPVSAPTMPYVAFQIRFNGNHEFVGTDNVRHRELRYERAPPGTEP